MKRNREIEMRKGENIGSQKEGAGAAELSRFNDGQFPLPSALQRRLRSMFHDSRTCDSERATPRSTFLARTIAGTSGTQTRLSHNALFAFLS